MFAVIMTSSNPTPSHVVTITRTSSSAHLGITKIHLWMRLFELFEHLNLSSFFRGRFAHLLITFLFVDVLCLMGFCEGLDAGWGVWWQWGKEKKRKQHGTAVRLFGGG
jgi:hypothetical protein